MAENVYQLPTKPAAAVKRKAQKVQVRVPLDDAAHVHRDVKILASALNRLVKNIPRTRRAIDGERRVIIEVRKTLEGVNQLLNPPKHLR
jgi:hypothetical protein